MKTLLAMMIGAGPLLAAGACFAQSGNMMNGGNGSMWDGGWMGGHGGIWVPTLLIIVVVGLVAWVITHNKK